MTLHSFEESPRSLADHVADKDQARFVGRSDELGLVEEFLGDGSPHSIAFIHGPGGIGKSALLREIGRRATRMGYTVRSVDGRISAGSTAVLEAAASELRGSRRPLLIVDSYERAEAIGGHLREHLLKTMPEPTKVVIAGRNRSEPVWWEGGWEAVTTEISLQGLSDTEARQLMSHLGVTAPETVERLVTWASGEPLALVLGAGAGTRIDTSIHHDLEDLLADRLIGDEIDDVDPRVLAIASIARAVDGRLIGAMFDDIDGGSAFRQLRRISFAEDLGDRVTLHERVRKSLRARLSRQDPGQERDLRRRLGDHFCNRAKEGDIRYLMEFGALFTDPMLRWSFAADERGTYQFDRLRPGDERAAAVALGAIGTGWWEGVRRWFIEAPNAITTVRDSSGHLAGFAIMVSLGSAPPWVAEDAILGPRLLHYHQWHEGRSAVFWRDAFGFPKDPGVDPALPMVMALQGATAASGELNPEFTYGSAVVGDPVSIPIADAFGAVDKAELRVVDGERVVEGRVLHHGPDGLVGALRARLYVDLGLRPPESEPDRFETVVKEALKTFHNPLSLAASPLAQGDNPAQRADSVRRLIREALDAAFGEQNSQRTARSVIELGYLRPDTTHESAARHLHLSRSSYFRHLNRGTEQIAIYLKGRGEQDPG